MAKGAEFARARNEFLPVEGHSMMEREVDLDFCCQACDHPVGVTVRCAGQLLSLTTHVLAKVSVPCPCCGMVNKLSFEPDGTVHEISTPPSRIVQPSWN